jgi:hypothetical protein
VRIGYGKIGRSMPLTRDKCGSLGGDVEMAATVGALAERHPDDEFWLIGRNSGERPDEVGLPSNVINPWTDWGPELLRRKRLLGLNKSNYTVKDHQRSQELFDDLTLPTITGMDQIILWAGQHGTTNTPMPGVRDPNKLTKPHDWSAHYCSFLLRGVNVWRDVDPTGREEIWLNSDPRNYLKMRDLKWPLRHPVLAQHTYTHAMKHERYGDATGFDKWYVPDEVDVAEPGMHTSQMWKSRVSNVYARLEINGLLPRSPFGDLISYDETFENRTPFGLFINETRRYVNERIARVTVMRDWVLPLRPAWIHGKWSAASLEALGIDIRPAPWDQYYPRLHSSLCTFTTPASGTGWATAKPWEAFAAGTVCFFHPDYDTQDNILGDAPEWLREYLRVSSPNELAERVNFMRHHESAWLAVIRAQRAHFDRAIESLDFVKHIEARLHGGRSE